MCYNEKGFNVLKGNDEMARRKERRIDWLTIIPLSFCVVCMIFSFAKLYQSGNEIHILDLLDIFNSNIFSTFISMVICMSYRFFSEKRKKRERVSGLSEKWIALTVISTILYGVVALINTCIYNYLTSILLMLVSITYVKLFFKVMRYKNDRSIKLFKGEYYYDKQIT